MAGGCFLIFCGIPASGKSTVAKSLIKKEWNIVGKSVHFLHINYDEFIPENLTIDDFSKNATWKERRRDILNSLEEFLLPKEGQESLRLESHSHAPHRTPFVTSWCQCGFNNRIIRCSDIFHVIVVDDNMFYRSMRYEYYKLAQKIFFGFAQVCIHCPLDVALLRNAERQLPVSNETIVKMFNCIEEPDPEKFSWEKFCATIDTSQSLDTCDSMYLSQTSCNVIFTLLENATLNPPLPLEISDAALQAKDLDRAITMKSIVHQADQVIRKLISIKLQAMKAKDRPSHTLKQEAFYFNQRRKMIVGQIKKDPRQIVHHILHDRDLRIGGQTTQLQGLPASLSLDKGDKSDGTSNQEGSSAGGYSETKKACVSVDMDKNLQKDIWEILSPDDFADAVKIMFERM